MCEVLHLADGGLLHYHAGFLGGEQADRLLDHLREALPWGLELGWGRPLPRLVAWVADAGLRYAYSGVSHAGSGWPPALAAVRLAVERAAGQPFNSCLGNLYRDARDSIAWHADDEECLGRDPIIASVTLGATREFLMRHRTSRARLSLPLAHGSLLIMGGTTQHHWLHCVNKTAEEVGPRLNLTFRRIRHENSARPDQPRP
jgi:alkylated DNA repair dioxygenase AlkB